MAAINTTITATGLTIYVQGVGDIFVDPSMMSGDIQQAAMLHGFKQKIVDAAAMSRNPETGASATNAEKFAAMQAVVDQLKAGDWNRRATGGEGSGDAGLLVRALVELTGRSLEDIRTTVEGMDKKTQAAMRGDVAIAPVIARLKAERPVKKADAGIDTAAMLASLGVAPF